MTGYDLFPKAKAEAEKLVANLDNNLINAKNAADVKEAMDAMRVDVTIALLESFFDGQKDGIAAWKEAA